MLFFECMFFIKKQGNKYIIQLKKMGNQQNSHPQLFTYLKDTKSGDLNQKEYPFIVKQILAQSSQHHQQLITTITRLKHQKNEYFVRVIDSHTVQTHHLCSIISHIYVLMQKPRYSLESFAKKLQEQGLSFKNQQIISILTAFSKICQSLKQEGQELTQVNQSIIFINQVGHQQINIKVMHPFFSDLCLEKQQNNSIQKQLASLLLSFKLQISKDLYTFLVLMADDKISLKEVTERLSEHHKRTKSGLQLVKHISNEPKLARQSINSLASNGQSLMINGGDVSELMFKDFYEHFDNSISQIEMRSTDGDLLSEIIVDQEISHRFPKRYLRSKAFKKTNKREGYSEWSEKYSQKHNITRDQSMKDNFRRQQKNYLFGSAKLVESFVSELHHQ